MTFQGRIHARPNAAIVPAPGEIWHFRTDYAPYPKFHLCVSYDRHFLFMNSPKPRQHLGNFVLPEASVRRLPRNREGISIVSCTTVIRQPDHVTLTPDDARGSLLPDEVLDIVDHIETYGLIERAASKPWLSDLREWAETMSGFRRQAGR